MKLNEFRQTYYSATRRVSQICQTSSLGGIGVVWALKSGTSITQLTDLLIQSLVCFFLALALDLAQYVWRTVAWGVMATCREKGLPSRDGDQEVLDPPSWVNCVALIFFALKVLVMLAGFGFLFAQARALLS